jgi:hypothetical protein
MLGDLNSNFGRSIFSNRQLGVNVSMSKVRVMIMESQQQNSPHQKLWFLGTRYFLTETFRNTPGTLLMKKNSQSD